MPQARGLELPVERQTFIREKIEGIIKRYEMDPELIYSHEQMESVVRYGVGAHHAGQLLVWRLLLEELMSTGALRLLIATGTVAAGVDFPARTVVVTAHSKRGADGFRTLTASELQQMSGRAGRRGRDTLGLCVVAPGPFCDARIISEVAARPPEPLHSAYFASPSTVLNLLKFRSVDDLRYTVERSLACFADRQHAVKMNESASKEEQEVLENKSLTPESQKKHLKRIRRKRKESEDLKGKQVANLEQTLKGLEKLGFLENGRITEKGLWGANLCTHLLLELSEAVGSFLINGDLPLEELIGLVASIAGDSHRNYLTIKQVPIAKEKFKQLEEIVVKVREAFEVPFNPELKTNPDAAGTVLAWLSAESWQTYNSLLKLGGVADGDAGRLIMQTAEHLSQMSRLFETHPELARLAAEGKRRLLRPPLSEELVD
jgi:superfamily II RNA helicase